MLPERRTIAVHPNSTAARKWKRSTWTTTLTRDELRSERARQLREKSRQIFVEAAKAKQRGDDALYRQLRAAAMRARQRAFTCG